MLAWLRRVKIRRINLFGVELEIDHPAFGSEGPASNDGTPAIAQVADVHTSEPPRLTVHGEVVGTIDKDLGIRVRNEDEIREFWRVHQIDSLLDWFGKGPPVFSIGRKEDRARCRPGDEASMTVIVQDRANGKRGIRTVAFEILRRS